MKPLLVAAAAAAIALAASACGSSRPVATAASKEAAVALQPRVLTSSRLIQKGAVRCVASIPSPAPVGRALPVTFRVKNVSDHKVAVPLALGALYVVVHAADGTTYDTRVPYEQMASIPYIAPTPIEPGATVTRTIPYLRVRWSGPLRVTPGCAGSSLPILRIPVTTPGSPTTDRQAVANVVEAAGHLLDKCRPTAAGVAVTGWIAAPKHSAPPLYARCSVSLRHERGFDVAQALIVTPPNLRGVHVSEPYEGLSEARSDGRNTEVIAWQFVVTRADARSVYSAEVETNKSGSGKMAPDWEWTSAGHGLRPGGSRCGGSGSGFGGIEGPTVEFVSICR